jgi:hypothetical protein
MKTITKFLKVTLVGGLLVVLPVWVSLLLLLKAINGALAMLLPIAKLLPQWFVHEKVAALVLLLVICFVVGLLIRTGPGRRFGDWLSQHILDRIPGFSLMRGMTRQLAGKKGEQSFQPALVEIEDAFGAGIHHRETRGRTVHGIRLVQSDADGGGYIYSATRTRASGGCPLAEGDGLHHEVGCWSSRDACRDSVWKLGEAYKMKVNSHIVMSTAELVVRDWRVGVQALPPKRKSQRKPDAF